MKIFNYILHILFPTRCPVCGGFIGFEESFCDKCRDKLMPFCGDFIVEGADGFCAAYEYDGNIAPAVILLKNGVCGNAAYALGEALADVISKSEELLNADYLVPVPLSKDKLRERGYNQASLIAEETGKRLGLTVQKGLIKKNRTTKEQKSLSAHERKINLSGAFSAVNPDLIKGKNILIIDDVCTTGSTLSELSGLLKRNGAAKVYCAACCKTPLKEKK